MSMTDGIIKRVLENSKNGQMSVVFGKNSGLKKDEYVIVFRMPEFKRDDFEKWQKEYKSRCQQN
jgi:hypothetical protein